MCLWAAVNLHKSYHLLFIHVVDVRLRKMTLHTRRAPNNCGASGRASRPEIKQELSHNPCLLKIILFRRGWWILGCILSSGCGGNCLISVDAMRKRLYVTVCLCSSASVTYSMWHAAFDLAEVQNSVPSSRSFKSNLERMSCSQRRFTIWSKLCEENKLNARVLTDVGNSTEDDSSNTFICKLAINDALKILHNEGFPLKHLLPSNCNQNTLYPHVARTQHVLI